MLHDGLFFVLLLLSADFSRNTIRLSNVFGSRSGHNLSVLIWVQTVCKGYQQVIKSHSSKERVNSEFQKRINQDDDLA